MDSFISLRVLLCTALLFQMQSLYYCQVISNVIEPNCNQNCTGLESEEFCATNGKTYNNTCEMNRDACLTGIDIQHQDDGPCVVPTVTPTKGEACKKRIETVSSQQKDICKQSYLSDKVSSETLTLIDLNQCYTPTCGSDENIYAPTQSHTVRITGSPMEVTYYWCSGPDGLAINGTLSINKNSINCSHRQSCHYEGKEYQDGSEFGPSHRCGICECLDGEVTCFDDFLPDMSGRLNDSQLNLVSDWLKRFFYFQSNLRDAVIPDIRKIPVTPILGTTQERKLREAFNHYDKSGNGFIRLNHSEESGLHHHISQVTFCDLRHVLNHISEEFDTNGNGRISRDEWVAFFERYTTQGVDKRDVSEGSIAGRMQSSLTVSQESIARKVRKLLGASEGSTARRVQKSTAPRLRRRSLESRKKFYYTTV